MPDIPRLTQKSKRYRCRLVTLLALCSAILPSRITAEDIELSYSLFLTAENLGIHRDIFFEENRAAIKATGANLGLVTDFSFMGGRRYPAHSTFQLGRYFRINDASINYRLGNLGLYAGYTPHYDAVDTPYSVYISSVEIPVLNAGFRWDLGGFFYENRWVRLNERSGVQYVGKTENYRDRGMTYKTFGFTFDALTIGFQDSYIYLDQPFDAESFLSPVPMYVLEMVFDTRGRPWDQSNDVNSLMGFFAEWQNENLYLESQILVDDINASILAPILGNAIPALNEIENLSKLAWNVGGRMKIRSGSVGFYHGGATKYTFGATYTNSSDYSTHPYEYTYFPATEYEYPTGQLTEIYYPENYIGYKYGENGLAFMVDYSTSVFPYSIWSMNLEASMEWAINGAKSPANPWHEYDSWLEIDVPVELLSDETVEHLLQFTINLSKKWRDFDFAATLLLGYGWNRLELAELVAGEPKIYVPQAGNNGFLFSVTLGGTYGLNLQEAK